MSTHFLNSTLKAGNTDQSEVVRDDIKGSVYWQRVDTDEIL